MSEQQTYNGGDAEAQRAQAWSDHVQDLIDAHWETMREAIGGAIGLAMKDVREKLEASIRVAVLEVTPEAMRQRELSSKMIAEAVDRLREEFHAAMKTNLRLVLLEQGFMPRVRGTWSEGESYSALDIVMADGVCWIAKVSNPGPLPGENWQILSCKGERGKPGPTGPRGEAGSQGPIGPAGPQGETRSASIVGWANHLDEYTIVPLLSNGDGPPNNGPPIKLREMFQRFLDETR